MAERLDQTDGIGGKHKSARDMADRAIRAQAEGDDDEADRLFAEATRIDPSAVEAALAERTTDPTTGAGATPQDDDEIAAMSRTIEPREDAPSRAGITGSGSGADGEGL